MFYHGILGLLRDGRPRHGYELTREYRVRFGRPANPGNFYRECAKLVSQGLIIADPNPADADARRIPYRITADGCRDFDEWLHEPRPLDGALDSWIMFADLLTPDDRMRLLDAMRETLVTAADSLARSRER